MGRQPARFVVHTILAPAPVALEAVVGPVDNGARAALGLQKLSLEALAKPLDVRGELRASGVGSVR
jgi:hypothetical protein